MAGYLGDRQTNLVHHLGKMHKECKIVDIKLKDRQYFTPDTLENAKSLNFSPCSWCTVN